MNPYVLIAVLLAGAAGGTLAYKGTVEAACAASLPDHCPTPIKNAFSAKQLAEAKVQIEYRDKIIPVITHDATEDRQREAETQQMISALNAQERTDACASSPAFELRRRQLCASVGGEQCAEAQP